MRIESARRVGDEICLTTKDPEAVKWVYQFKPGDYTITKTRIRRSLDANRYLWVLVGKIAAMVGIPSDDVYRNAIRESGEYTPLPIRADAVEEFSRIWSAHGVGWFIDILDDSKLPGYKLIRAYHGSSTYDTKQMSRLIDQVVQDAKHLGIETLTPLELARMKEEWK